MKRIRRSGHVCAFLFLAALGACATPALYRPGEQSVTERRAAIEEAGRQGRKAVPVLRRALNDENPLVQRFIQGQADQIELDSIQQGLGTQDVNG